MSRFRIRATALSLALVPGAVVAQPAGMPQSIPATAPAEPDALPLYGDKTPGSTGTEIWSKIGGVSLGVRNEIGRAHV